MIDENENTATIKLCVADRISSIWCFELMVDDEPAPDESRRRSGRRFIMSAARAVGARSLSRYAAGASCSPSLRDRRFIREFQGGLRVACERKAFRVCQYSIQRDPICT